MVSELVTTDIECNKKRLHKQHLEQPIGLSTLFTISEDDGRIMKEKDPGHLNSRKVNEQWNGVTNLLNGNINEPDEKVKRSKRTRIKETALRMKGNRSLLKSIHESLMKNKQNGQDLRKPALNPDMKNNVNVDWSNFQNPNVSLIENRGLRTEVTNLLFSQQSMGELLIDFRVPTILEGGYLRVRIKEYSSSPKILYIRPLLITKALASKYPELHNIMPLQKRFKSSIRSPHVIGGHMEATTIRSHFGTIHSYNESKYLIPVTNEIDKLRSASVEPHQKILKIELPKRFSKLACLLHSQSALNPYMRRPYTSLDIKLKRLKIGLDTDISVIGQQLQRLLVDSVSPYIVINLDGQPLYRTDCVVSSSSDTERRKYRFRNSSWQLTILFEISMAIGIHTPWSILEFVIYDKEIHNSILPELSTKIGSMLLPISKLIPGREESHSICNTFDVDVFQFNVPNTKSDLDSSDSSTSDEKGQKPKYDLITRFAVGNSEQNKIPMKLSLDIDIKLSNHNSLLSEVVASSMAVPQQPDCGSYHGFDMEELTAVLLRISGTISIAKICWKSYLKDGGLLLIGLWMVILYAFLMAPERWVIPLVVSIAIRLVQFLLNVMAIADHCLKPLVEERNKLKSPSMIVGMTDFKENRRQFTRILVNALLSIKAEAKLRKLSNCICSWYIKAEELSKTIQILMPTHTLASAITIPDDITKIEGMALFVMERLKLKRTLTTNSRLIRLCLFSTAYIVPEALVLWLRKTSCLIIACLPIGYFLVHHELQLLFRLFLKGIKAISGKIKLIKERQEVLETLGKRYPKMAEPKRRPFYLQTM